MTQPVPLTSESAEQIGRAWLYHAHKIDLFLAHSRDQLRQIDGFPAGGEGGSGEHTPTEGPALARYSITSFREQIRDDLATIVELSNSLFRVLDLGLRTRAPESGGEAKRCHGGDADCDQWASDHTLATGQRHGDLCDDCWAKACKLCGKQSDGRLVDGLRACENCYRRDLRQRTKAVA